MPPIATVFQPTSTVKLIVTKLKLVPEHRTGKDGKPLAHIAMSHIKIVRDDGSYVRFAKHTEELRALLESRLQEMPIEFELEGASR